MPKTLQLTVPAVYLTLSDFDVCLLYQCASMTPVTAGKDDAERRFIEEISKALEDDVANAKAQVEAFEKIPLLDVAERKAGMKNCGSPWIKVMLTKAAHEYIFKMVETIKTAGANWPLVTQMHAHLNAAVDVDEPTDDTPGD